MSKKQLGQFYTTNYEYILSNMEIPEDTKTIIEPFVGNGDLLKFIKNKCEIEMYDIDPKYPNTIKQDTLENPPDYTNKFVLTNPPYLARNKSKKKEIYNKYKCNDLYKCFISKFNRKCMSRWYYNNSIKFHFIN
jgi:site-specific DNA-adenine methylase